MFFSLFSSFKNAENMNMMTITTYTEPIPIEAAKGQTSPSDPQQVHENEENDKEQSSFAKILEGMLQKTQTAETVDIETGLDLSAVEESGEGNKLNFFANMIESKIDFESIPKIETDVVEKIPIEHLFGDEINLDDSVDLQLVPEVDAEAMPRFTETKAQTEPVFSQADVQTAQFATSNEINTRQINDEPVTNENGKKTNNTEKTATDLAPEGEKVEVVYTKNDTGEEDAQLADRKDTPGRLEEHRSRARKDRIAFDIHDMRSANEVNAQRSYSMVEASAMRVTEHTGTQEITLDLRLPDYGQSSQAQTMWETKAGSALENMLARELHQSFNGDIVRHASMALRDGGSGTIKIALHPETLGNVKIQLELSDNKITGFISVESEEALNAFRRELASLEQAFREAGFAEANLDLSLTHDGFNEQQEQLGEGVFSSLQVAASYEDSSYEGIIPEEQLNVLYGQKAHSVNMLA